MTRAVRRPTSRVTHAQMRDAAAQPAPDPEPRPPSYEALTAGPAGADGVVLIAVRLSAVPLPDAPDAPDLSNETPEEVAERVRRHVNGTWLHRYGTPYQVTAVAAWPAPDDWDSSRKGHRSG